MLTHVEQRILPDVIAATAGDRSAFERLINQCRHTVTGIALAIVKDLDASEEVAQDVFIYIWQQLGSLREPASFLPWVRQMTRHRSYNYLRDNKVKQKVLGDEAETLLENFADPTSSMQDLLELGSEDRMNRPGVPDGNWRWRFRWDQVEPRLAGHYRHLLTLYGRI